MDQKKIYKNVHPSDFTNGSIIKCIDDDLNKGVIYIVTDKIKEVVGSEVYAIRLNTETRGNYFINPDLKRNYELIKGSLK